MKILIIAIYKDFLDSSKAKMFTFNLIPKALCHYLEHGLWIEIK